ncbi:hypothetical protein BH10ACI2_BH10ACI2_23370 [soil metagenome]
MPLNGHKKLRSPVVKIDKRLNELAKEDLFSEKVEMAERMLKGVELPTPKKTSAKKNSSTSRTTSRVPV